MPQIHQLLSFALAAVFIVLIPGPNMTFLITCAATQSRKVAILALLGSNAALLTLGILTGAGLSTLLKAVPFLYDALKIAGAFYFFWLAAKSIFVKDKAITGNREITLYSNKQAFKAGYFTNILNPKAAAFYVAIFPQFLLPASGHMVFQGAALGMVHALVSFIINGTIIISVAAVAGMFQGGNKLKHVKKWGSAILFTAFGIRMLLQKSN